MDCTLVGPETACFCKHRFKDHQTDFKELPTSRPILLPCREKGCPCSSFYYVPKNGSQPIRCSCKHSADEHKLGRPYNCLKSNPKFVNIHSWSILLLIQYRLKTIVSVLVFEVRTRVTVVSPLITIRLWLRQEKSAKHGVILSDKMFLFRLWVVLLGSVVWLRAI